MCVLSRPSTALCVLMLAPLYMEMLLKKGKHISIKLAEASVFLLPALLGCVVLLVYNQLRFGSFMDFGTNYQLTVSDVHANHLSLAYIPDTIASYFLQFPCVRAAFPFIEMRSYSYANYGKYIYTDHNIGILMIPFIMVGLLLVRRALRRDNIEKNGGGVLLQRSFITLSLAIMFFVAWMDFCMAGVNMRYIVDITTPAAVVSLIAVLKTTKNNKSFQYTVVTAAMIVSMVMIMALSISERGGTLATLYSELYDKLEDLIVFWR